MRQIKFRVWDKEKKEMIYFTLDELYDSLIATGYVNPYPEKERLRRLMRIVEYNRSEDVRMQFTGLLDKNKKEIYAGDIVEQNYPTFSEKIRAVIVSRPGGFFSACIKPHINLADIIAVDKFLQLEVIGNVYKNKELLEENP